MGILAAHSLFHGDKSLIFMVERRQDSKRKHFGFVEGALQLESPSLTALRQALGTGFGNKFKHDI